MNKYIISQRMLDNKGNITHLGAGTKAVSDVENIAKQIGYIPIYIDYCKGKGTFFDHIKSQLLTLRSWVKVLCKVKRNDTLLIQCPIHRRQLGRRLAQRLISKKSTIVSLIHDVEELRVNKEQISKNDKTDAEITLKYSNYIIVHNAAMKEYFASKGIDRDRLICLEIFDYLTDEKGKLKSFNKENAVTIAGNCAKEKAPYIYMLDKTNCKYELYGTNYIGEEKNNINYHGAVESGVLPAVIEGNYGLIWDGGEISTCSGNTGRYLRYNNPHKTSLYIVSGLPIIIWEKAAMAQFVLDNRIGVTVSSLEEMHDKISMISEDEYNKYAMNCYELADKLSSGFYTKKALEYIESIENSI